MAKNAKKAFILVLLAILPSYDIAGVASAQSNNISTPQFSLKLHDNSTIWITIENQPFNYSSAVNALEYYYRVKDHNGQVWSEDRNYVLQSDTQYTIIPVQLDTLPYKLYFINLSILDFQVQAITGYYNVTQKPGYMSGFPSSMQGNGGYTEITFNESEYSGWSTTQTITLPETYIAVPSNPTPEPTIPELQVAPALPLLAASILFAVALVYFRSRKQKWDSPNLPNAELG